jgi:hypothetical protein
MLPPAHGESIGEPARASLGSKDLRYEPLRGAAAGAVLALVGGVTLR